MPKGKEIKYSLILASESPRRKELLAYIGIDFDIHSVAAEEVSQKVDQHEIVQDISKKKGIASLNDLIKNKEFKRSYFPVVIASDTIVCLGQKIMGKPGDINEARAMLKELAGRTHKVLTGVYIGFYELTNGKYKEHCFSLETEVEFDNFSDDTLEIYLATKDSLDKAGGYGVQGAGQVLVKKLSGSYSNVVGLPVSDFITKLKSTITSEDDDTGRFRDLFHGSV
ncbi:MAG: septum formation protein Maf [Bacteriovoracaceae bacterium]|jgi:septum formation protein|nr:septum formation protein Maf [Bacteriovoracaceae bacterium]